MSSIQEKRTRRLEQITQMDTALWQQGISFAGVDEVGRGPLCGPVMAACVVMPKTLLLLGVDDSKKVSEKRRIQLCEEIEKVALFVGLGLVEPDEIDRLNIVEATKLAMQKASAGAPVSLFLVDGNVPVPLPGQVRLVVHGDGLCYSIAAASIVAKVKRDALMQQMDSRYPGYGLAQNKGYGTAQHIAALRERGPCPGHRRSFIGNFVGGGL